MNESLFDKGTEYYFSGAKEAQEIHALLTTLHTRYQEIVRISLANAITYSPKARIQHDAKLLEDLVLAGKDCRYLEELSNSGLWCAIQAFSIYSSFASDEVIQGRMLYLIQLFHYFDWVRKEITGLKVQIQETIRSVHHNTIATSISLSSAHTLPIPGNNKVQVKYPSSFQS